MGILDYMMSGTPQSSDGLRPSETGKDSMSLDELNSLVPGNKGPKDKYGRPTAKGDPWTEYLKTMQYLTQPKKDMGPDARRALGGMPQMPPAQHDPVQMQSPGMGSSLMSLLFGGAK